MRTDLTACEHMALHIIDFYSDRTTRWYPWSNTSSAEAEETLTTLVNRGLVEGDRPLREINLQTTQDGALLARIYGEP